MVTGELIPHVGMRGCWNLQNVNDSSGNGRTLTNINTVPFNPGKFNLGADFGSSGTTKSLGTSVNPMSALTYANATVSCWVKFNSVTATSGALTPIFDLVTRLTTGTGAARTRLSYTAVTGTITLTCLTKLTTTDATCTYAFTATTSQWYHFVVQKSGTTTITLFVNGAQVNTNTGAGNDTQNAGANRYLNIGNRCDVATQTQAWVIVNQFIIEERIWPAQEIKLVYANGLGYLAPDY